MQLLSTFSKRFLFLLYVIDIYSKYAWVVPLKDKNGYIITNAFQKLLNESGHKPSKIGVEKGSEFYNRSMKSWLEKYGIEMCSTHNEGKSFATERSIRTFKNKICKYMSSISKNVSIDKLADVVNTCNNTYHPKLKVGDHVRISIYKNIFAKCYLQNWSKEVLLITKVKNVLL